MLHTSLVMAVFALTGLSVGSFLNLCIDRLPLDQSIVGPPSHCPGCRRRVSTLDLIPFLNYLWLRGRCRYCGNSIPIRLPAVELLTGLAFAFLYWNYGLHGELGMSIVYACFLIVIFFVDLEHMIIPDQCSAIVALFGIGVNGYHLWTEGLDQALAFTQRIGPDVLTIHLPHSIVGLLLGGGVFLFIGWLFEALLRKPALGMGDVKLAGAMGAVLGPGYALFSYFLLSILIGAAVSVLLLALRIKQRGDYIPFGPMMALAGIVMLLYTDPATLWILSWYR